MGRRALLVLAVMFAFAPNPTRAEPDDPLAEAYELGYRVMQLMGDGELEEALDVALQEVAAREQVLGPEDRGIVWSVIRVAECYAALDDRANAETQYERALTVMEQGGVAALRDSAAELEERLARRYAELRGANVPVTIERVQAELEEGAALLEIAVFRPRNGLGLTFDEPRYVAYVLRPSGEPSWVELGAASEIDPLVARLRAKFADPSVPGFVEAARALEERVMRPVRALLGNVRRIYLAPDGILSLVPFAALVDETGEYLTNRYQFTYLTSGRDLLRLRSVTDARTAGMLLAEPDYGRRAGTSILEFEPLPGTAMEADALAQLLEDLDVLTGAAATESALATSTGPRILHLATHGFFLADVEDSPEEGARAIRIRPKELGGESIDVFALPENPLLRSGLAFAGANTGDGGGHDDGILTAMEAANLDLHGTKLVVLSACDTGVGDVVNGDGVYGLRRAFVVAGAETVVMSLWQVDDTATKDLMVGYYQRLVAGEGRVEAMRQVQLAMLHDPETAHPYYWAAFVVSGNPDTLDGDLAPLPKLGRGARGCGCSTGGPDAGAGLVVFALIVAARRRRRGRMLG